MREDYGSLSLVTHDQGFGDMSFDAEPPELLRHGSGMEPSLDQVFILCVLSFTYLIPLIITEINKIEYLINFAKSDCTFIE